MLLVVVPGADWAFTLSAGLRGRSVVLPVGGLVLGHAAITLIVAADKSCDLLGTPKRCGPA
ncbi:hypothetical protein [Microtetraspora fusca]|uniref:hypothetical protein n=1 Tax=Microtetraspora fusca TaxID=1997 RepID=UPI000832C16A|nr:hypothetical protein [Microtetraspora fusca]